MGKGLGAQWRHLWTIAVWWPAGLKERTGPLALLLFLVTLSLYVILEFLLFLTVDSSPPGARLPLTTNSSEALCNASPFCVINTKSLLLGPVDFFLHKPISILLNDALHLDRLVSANFVSVGHILVAAVSVKLLAHESLLVRRLGVVAFELRNLLDSLDGVIARAHAQQIQTSHPTGLLINPEAGLSSVHNGNFWGYAIDGICDGVGCILLMTGCLLFLQRHVHKRRIHHVVYSPLMVVLSKGNGAHVSSEEGVDVATCALLSNNNSKGWSDESEAGIPEVTTKCANCVLCSLRRLGAQIWTALVAGNGLPAFLFLLQLLLSSILWNKTILVYTDLLEGGRAPADQLHSPFLWLIIFLWRLVNPMNLTELLLVAIFFDKMQDFLCVVQYVGFLVLFCVGALSEVHRSDMEKSVSFVSVPHPFHANST